MRSLIMVAFVAVALPMSGCAKLTNAWQTVTEAKVPAKTLIVAANAFDAAKAGATGYITYCTPRPQPAGCSDAAIAKLIPAVRAGTTARNNAKAFIAAHPGELGTQGLYDGIVSATETLTQIKAQYNIN